MEVIFKPPGKAPQTKNFSRREYMLSELTVYGLSDEYEIDSNYHLVLLYNGNIPMNERQNITVHADGSLFCGMIYIVSKRKDGDYGHLSKVEREVAFEWLRQRCSWIKKRSEKA